MIVIDTNIVLASLRQPVTDHDAMHHEKATRLMGEIAAGSTNAIIPEIVVHECFYVLVMRDRDTTVENFCDLMGRMLVWPGWSMDKAETEIYKYALRILQDSTKLEFSDAVIAARAEAHGAELATFDKRLAAAFDGPIWAES